MNEQAPCECKGPETPGQPNWLQFCTRYQIMQTEYAWKVCNGIDCPIAKSQTYRAKWAANLAALSAGGPGLIQKAVNAAKAVVKAAANSFRLTPDDVLAERERICNACEFKDKSKEICTHPNCGCNLRRNLKSGGMIPGKLEVASESCPLGKFKAV